MATKNSLVIWTRDYDFNGVSFRILGYRADISSMVKHDLGHGYFAYEAKCNQGYYKGDSLFFESTSGAVIGSSLDRARSFIKHNWQRMPEQIKENSKRLKNVTSSMSSVWEAYYR